MGDPDSYVGNYEFQVPSFVLTHEPPHVQPKQDEHLTFKFVTDGVSSSCCEPAWSTSCASMSCRCCWAAGLRFFENASLSRVQLEKIGVQQVGARSSFGFRVEKKLD